MTTHIPPAHTNSAAPLDWETATVEDLWRASDLARVSAGAIFCALDKDVRLDAECV